MNKKRLLVCALLLLWITSTFSYIIFSRQKFSQLVIISKPSIPVESRKNEETNYIFNFFSPEDHLGAVIIPFDNNLRFPKGNLTFKIKEAGSDKWYYSVVIDMQQFVGLPRYPFGFLPIKNSQSKTFEIELGIKEHESSNHFIFDLRNQSLSTYYQYDKSTLIKDKDTLIQFLFKKYYYSLLHNNLKLVVPIFGLPLFIFLLGLVKNNAPLYSFFTNPILITFGFLIIIIMTSIMFSPVSDLVILLVTIGWLIYNYNFKVKSIFSFSVSVILQLLNIYLTYFLKYNLIENISIWSFAFLVVGLIQTIYQNNYSGN